MSDSKAIDQRTQHELLLRSQIEAAGKSDMVAPQLIELAVKTWWTWQQAIAALDTEGITVKNSQGISAHPATQIARQACQTYAQLLGRMGLSTTPTASRYAASKPTRLAPTSSISELMARKPEKIQRPS
jgi:phage terminase small subunit